MKCDRCGADITNWPVGSGNCTDCGDDLCAKCAGSFNADGECEVCAGNERYYVYRDVTMFEILTEDELLALPVDARGDYRLIKRNGFKVERYKQLRKECREFTIAALRDAGLLI